MGILDEFEAKNIRYEQIPELDRAASSVWNRNQNINYSAGQSITGEIFGKPFPISVGCDYRRHYMKLSDASLTVEEEERVPSLNKNNLAYVLVGENEIKATIQLYIVERADRPLEPMENL